MCRSGRVVIAGLPHHVTHRGNRKQEVFVDDSDRQKYLGILKERAAAYNLNLWAYALMSNHIHLICVPEQVESLSRAIGRTEGDYASYYNFRHCQVGQLWHGRFRSSVMDQSHLMNATRYVERNPVRAGMVDHAEDYHWSSAPAHCSLRADPLLASDFPLLREIPDWSAWLQNPESQETLDQLRFRTARGHPIGSRDFVQAIERRVGREFNPPQHQQLAQL